MVNYELGKIYKIVCNETGLIYIGSTAQKYLSTRLGEHKRDYKRFLNGKCSNVTSFKIIEGNNFEIILLENCLCKNKYELKARERHYIETKDCVNIQVPNRTQREYKLDNQEIVKKRDKLYRELNKDKIKQYYECNKESLQQKGKEYREANKVCLKEYRSEYYENNADIIKQSTKQYKEANKDIFKVKNKNYREDNKDKINENIKCLCGCEVIKRQLKRHEQTKKHIALMNKL